MPSRHNTSVYALLEEFPRGKQVAVAHLTRPKSLFETASKGRCKRDIIRELDNEIAEIETQIKPVMEAPYILDRKIKKMQNTVSSII